MDISGLVKQLVDAERAGSDLQINRTFTIGAGAAQDAFSCGTSSSARVHVNAPNGHLIKAGGGLTRSFSGIENDLFVQPNTVMVLGDARKTLNSIVSELG